MSPHNEENLRTVKTTELPLQNHLIRDFRKPGIIIVFILFALITLSHYADFFSISFSLENLMPGSGLTSYTLERILYLVPLVWAGFFFGLRGAVIGALIALACMLPRAIFLAETPADAIIESVIVALVGFLISGLSAFSLKVFRRERLYIQELEKAHQESKISEERYRKLFENAHDGIWLQDMEGNIVTANAASTTIIGYENDRLIGMNVKEFLPEDSLEVARKVRRILLRGETLEGAYEQKFIRQDGNEVYLKLSTSLIIEDGEPTGFLHIARDVTSERNMEENLKFYIQEATEAQEEERKRISRELHDDTIQALVVLSQQLDILASRSKDLSDADRQTIEKLQQDTVEIMTGIRRLSQDLRPATLDRLGLEPALEWLANEVTKYSGIEINIISTGEKRRLAEYEELILFRVTQEALRNAARHSGATRVNVHIEFTTITVRIVISDNGRGFEAPKAIGGLARQGKLGLAGMQERVRLIGGDLKVKTRHGKGTDITVELITDQRLRMHPPVSTGLKEG